MNNIKEIWKDIVGYEGFYQVSNMGNVRGLDRYILAKGATKPSFYKGKMMTPTKEKNGYLGYRLRKNGNEKITFAHRIVAMAFIENPENKPHVNHINGIRNDNRLSNLEWVTPKENAIHGVNRRSKIDEQRHTDCSTIISEDTNYYIDEIPLNLSLFNLIGKYKTKDGKHLSIGIDEVVILNYMIENLNYYRYDCWKPEILCFYYTNTSIYKTLNISQGCFYKRYNNLLHMGWIERFKPLPHLPDVIIVNKEEIIKYKNRNI